VEVKTMKFLLQEMSWLEAKEYFSKMILS